MLGPNFEVATSSSEIKLVVGPQANEFKVKVNVNVRSANGSRESKHPNESIVTTSTLDLRLIHNPPSALNQLFSCAEGNRFFAIPFGISDVRSPRTMIIAMLTRGMPEKPKQIACFLHPSHDDFLHHNCVSSPVSSQWPQSCIS
jgi:hypothetical protein